MMRYALGLCLGATCLSGCATNFGASVMPEARFHYNEAVAVSSNEQILLNIVRIRFNHTVQFLEPTNVVTSWSIARNATVGATSNLNADGGVSPLLSGTLGAGISSTETPTITYRPLSGAEFVRQLAQPVGPEIALRLISSGWEADLVLEMTTERLNELPAPTLSSQDAGGFRAVLGELRKLQSERRIDVEPHVDGSLIDIDAGADANRLLRLLNIPQGTTRLRITTVRVDRAPDELAVRTRSLLSTLSYASLGVEVADGDPTAYKLDEAPEKAQPFLRVRSSETAPEGAFVQVPYRGRWYWIDDADLSSKRTFSLLALLFGLMSAPDVATSPVLTLPAGR